MKKFTSIDEILKITDNDKASAKELISAFILQLNEQLDEFKTFTLQYNIQEIINIAHKMKSSLGYFGMADQRLMAVSIEEIAGKDFEKTKQLIEKITADSRFAIEELKETLKNMD